MTLPSLRLPNRRNLLIAGTLLAGLYAASGVSIEYRSSIEQRDLEESRLRFQLDESERMAQLNHESASLSIKEADIQQDINGISQTADERGVSAKKKTLMLAQLEEELGGVKREEAELGASSGERAHRQAEESAQYSMYEYRMQRRADYQKLALLVGFLPIAGLFLLAYLRATPEETPPRQTGVQVASPETSEVTSTQGEDAIAVIDTELIPQGNFGEPATVKVSREDQISGLFDATQNRLYGEVLNLGRRSNLNLVVGVLITAAATSVLVYMVTRPHPDFSNLAGVFAYYIPRVTTIALIETFAYFFLRLYKSNLEEIKYYQNERTTLVAIEIAWRASSWPELGDTTTTVIQQLAKTERNTIATGLPTATGTDQGDALEIVKALVKVVAEAVKSKDKG